MRNTKIAGKFLCTFSIIVLLLITSVLTVKTSTAMAATGTSEQFDSFVSLVKGRKFSTKDHKHSLSVALQPDGGYTLNDAKGGYRISKGNIDIDGNIYSLSISAFSGTASFTMDGDTAVSLSYKGEGFYNGTYYPCWRVYCNANGGSMWAPASEILVYDGERATKPAKENLPYKENYTFVGWFTEKEGGSEFNFNTPIHEDVIIYAHWYRDFTVTYDDNREGGKTQQVKVEEGKELPDGINPTGSPTGYHFSGWYTDPKCSEKFIGPVTQDITLYARWERSEFTVSFDVQGLGTNPEPTKVLYENLLIYAPTPSYGQYYFDGWYRNKECTYRWSYSNHTVTEDITLYAKWIDPCKVTFVTSGNGTTPESITTMYESKISAPKMEAGDYKSFDGWYTDEARTKLWHFNSDIVNSDLTLYGHWTDACMVNFITDHGDAPQIQVVPCGQKVSRPADPWADGYVFVGWYTDSSFTTPWNFDTDNVPEAYLYLYARWEKEVWIMIDPHNGGDALVISGITGDLVDLSSLPPIRNGEKQIAGWYTDSAYKKPFDLSNDRVVEGLTLHIAWNNSGTLPASIFGEGSIIGVSILGGLLLVAIIGCVVFIKKKK